MMKYQAAALLIILCASFAFSDQDEYSTSITDRIHINGEGGVVFFDTEGQGEFPNDEFRVDEAKLFVEAAIFEDIYVFGEINLFQREGGDENVELGELYLEIEDIGNKGGLFNVRLGRFDIPFGEEYLTRDAIDNPLISHSLSDVWGIDEGAEAYGSFKTFEYTVAIQNGGEPLANDFNSDKAVAVRVLYRPSARFHFSGSAMRTGELDVQQDRFSEVWFANGFLLPLGNFLTTTTISGNLFQGDGHAAWGRGHLHLAAGRLHYDDDDTTPGAHSRDVNYFYVEALHRLNQSAEFPWYVAGRFSRMASNEGFPMVGHGNFETFLFNPDELAEELWRLSLGIGYRLGRNVLFKAEYTFENGEQIDGAKRDQENFVGVEAAMRF